MPTPAFWCYMSMTCFFAVKKRSALNVLKDQLKSGFDKKHLGPTEHMGIRINRDRQQWLLCASQENIQHKL